MKKDNFKAITKNVISCCFSAGAEVEGWGMWEVTEGPGSDGDGAGRTHSQSVWG